MKHQHGYRLVMFFDWLPAIEQAIARVATRVREGGHNIPEETIRRRYQLGIQNFSQLYAPFIDHWVVYDGSDRPAVIVVEEENSTRTLFDDDRYAIILGRTSRAAAMIRDNKSVFIKQADAAMEEAAEVVLQRARQHNTPIVVWRDGKVVELDPFSPEFDDAREEQPPTNQK